MNKAKIKEVNQLQAQLKASPTYRMTVKCRACKMTVDADIDKGTTLRNKKCPICQSQRLERV